MLLLALGISLTTKTGLGVSPIISVPFSIATIFEFNFADITFLTYIIFILIQVLIKKKKTRVFDLLQIALSVILTRVLYLFSEVIEVTLDHQFMRFLVLIVAILLTGIGAAMTMKARLVANPGDGIVQTISDTITGIL